MMIMKATTEVTRKTRSFYTMRGNSKTSKTNKKPYCDRFPLPRTKEQIMYHTFEKNKITSLYSIYCNVVQGENPLGFIIVYLMVPLIVPV